MANPTPEEAAAKQSQVTTNQVQTPVAAKTNLTDAATQVVNAVHDAELAYANAKQVSPLVQQDLAPVLGGEPALVLGTIVAVVVAVLSLTHVIDVSTSVGFITSAGPLVTGIITRFFVSPTTK